MKPYSLRCESGKFTLTGGVSRATLSSSHTGRSIDVETAYAATAGWDEACTTESRVHPLFDSEFARAIRSTPVTTHELVVFRGRKMTTNPSSVGDLGPSPAPARGRYNWKGVSVLYTCTSVAGVVAELAPIRAGETLWVQRLLLPAALTLMDARALPPRSFAAGAFWRVEHRRDRDGEPLALGPRLADLASELFEGFIVPGVRGTPDAHYANVVVFRPAEQWRQWIVGQPFVVSAA